MNHEFIEAVHPHVVVVVVDLPLLRIARRGPTTTQLL